MKTTIKEIDLLVEDFEFQLRNIKSSDKKQYKKEVALATSALTEQLKKLQLLDPVLVPFSLGNDWDEIFRSIAEAAEERKPLRWAYAGGYSYQSVEGVRVDMPLFHDLQDGFNVLIKEFDSGDHDRTDDDHAEKVMNQYLMYILLSYPRGKVRLNFIDLYFSGKADTFFSQLGNQGEESICRLLQDEREIEDCLGGEMKRRMAEINRMGDRYYFDHAIYELFVLLDYPRSYDNITDKMELLLEKGGRYGIQFVVLHDTNPRNGLRNDRAFDILSLEDTFTLLDAEIENPKLVESVHFANDLFDNDEAIERCFEYLKNGVGDTCSIQMESNGFASIVDPTMEDEPSSYFADLEERIRKNVVIPSLAYSTIEPVSRGKYGVKRNIVPWMAEGNIKKNFVIQYTGQSKDHAEDLLNQLVMNAMLSLPITKVHVTIINPQNLYMGTFLNKEIEDCLVSEIISENEIGQFLSSMFDKMRHDRSKLGCSIERYNQENQTILRPYEIVILLSPESFSRSDLFNLFDNGSNSGIYFIALADKDKQQSVSNSDSVIKHNSVYQSIDAVSDYYIGIDSAIIAKANRFSRDRIWMPAAVKYINERSVVTVKHDWDAVIRAPYAETSPDMSVTIGYESSGAPVEFKIGINNDHYHGFVIGGTGSGKSRFLHNIILGLSLKYRPEALELHILDLKGAEFGRYKQLKQARSVLVEEADAQITYEVLSEIERKIDERKVLFARYGATDLKHYYKNGKGPQLPQILLIVDECQELFVDKSDDSDLTKKIVNVIKLIATKGRSWGVHMLLGTQSLSNAPKLDEGTLTQIQDHFILPCVDSDAKQLVSSDHKERVGMEAARLLREKKTNPGQCFYQGSDGYKNFKFNYVSAGEMEESLLQACIDKASACRSNGQSFFSGRQHFSLFDNADRLVDYGEPIIASPGQTISLNQTPQLITLLREESQNILTIGYDDKQYVTRTSIGLFLSLLLSSRKSGKYYRFSVINCLGADAKEQTNLLKELETLGFCELFEPKQCGEYLRSLCSNIARGKVEPTILVVLRQESFVQLKNNATLPSDDYDPNDYMKETADPDDLSATLSMLSGMDFGSPSEQSAKADVKTYGDALTYILQRGPEHGVHTMMQINKSSEFCIPTGKYGTPDRSDIMKLFGHIVLLQSDNDTASFFSLYDLHLNELQESEDRLRAYYYNPNGGSSQLLSPYILPSIEDIKSNL